MMYPRPDLRFVLVRSRSRTAVWATDGELRWHVPDVATYREMTGLPRGDHSANEAVTAGWLDAIPKVLTRTEFEDYLRAKDAGGGDHPAAAHLDRIEAEVSEARGKLGAPAPGGADCSTVEAERDALAAEVNSLAGRLEDCLGIGGTTGPTIVVRPDIEPGAWTPAEAIVGRLRGDVTGQLRDLFTHANDTRGNFELPRGDMVISEPIRIPDLKFSLRGAGYDEGTRIISRITGVDGKTAAIDMGAPRGQWNREHRQRGHWWGHFSIEHDVALPRYPGALLRTRHTYDSQLAFIGLKNAMCGYRGSRQIAVSYHRMRLSNLDHGMVFDFQSNGIEVTMPRTAGVGTALHLGYVNGAVIRGHIFEGVTGSPITSVGRPTPFGSTPGDHYARCRAVTMTGGYYELAPGVIVQVGAYEGAVTHLDADNYFAANSTLPAGERYIGAVRS